MAMSYLPGGCRNFDMLHDDFFFRLSGFGQGKGDIYNTYNWKDNPTRRGRRLSCSFPHNSSLEGTHAC